MNASIEKSNDDFFHKLAIHGIKINLKLNDKPFLKVEDLILATRTKHSEIKDNNKEFFLKLQKPILHNEYSNDFELMEETGENSRFEATFPAIIVGRWEGENNILEVEDEVHGQHVCQIKIGHVIVGDGIPKGSKVRKETLCFSSC